jgi:hypothetical protein
MIDRRNFIGFAGAAAAFTILPVKIVMGNPLVAIAVKAAATSAGEYIGGGLLSSILGGSASKMPTTEDIINAIRSSTEEIKVHISQETRAAITEDRVRELQAACTSILGKLDTYSTVEPHNRSGVLYLLQDADLRSRDAIALAGKMGAPAFIPYSILVSLRIMVTKSLLDYNGYRAVYEKFAGELRGHVATIRTGYMGYRETLLPAVRVTNFQCSSQDSGGQFPIRMYRCTFQVDGTTITAVESTSPGGRVDSALTEKALQAKVQKENEVMSHLAKINREIGSPLLDAADEWELIANDITPGIISLSNRARGRTPPDNRSPIPPIPSTLPR